MLKTLKKETACVQKQNKTKKELQAVIHYNIQESNIN